MALYWRHLSDIYAVSVDGSGLRQVIDSKLTGAVVPLPGLSELVEVPTSFGLSPDGTQVVYSSCEFPYPRLATREGYVPEAADYQFEIVRAPTAGGAPQRLTTHRSFDNFPSWSPDGARIAFLSNRHSVLGGRYQAHLYTMAPDGTDIRDLTPDLAGIGAIEHSPQWAPDGQRLAFVAYSHDRRFETPPDLYTVRVDGTELRRLAPAVRSPVAWSPDGQRLAFVAYSHDRRFETPPDLYTVRVDGTELRRLAPAVRSPVAWSPDGQRLAFAQAVDDAVMLVTVAADGSDLQQLVPIEGWKPHRSNQEEFDAWINSVAWSPDGTRILVSANERQPAFIVGLDSPHRRDVGILRNREGRFHGVRASAWSPDGSQIALLGLTRVAILPADGGPIRGLAEHVGLAAGWQPLNASVLATPVDATGCGAGVAVADPAANAALVMDCAALLEVQQALADGGGLNWSVDRPMTEWDGLTLGGTPLRVQALALGESPLTRPPPLGELQRPLPAALGKLTQLQALHLPGNRFTGPIPPALGQLSALRELDLSSNRLTEAIPPELGQLINLETLDLAKNELTGPIPPELGQATNLRELDLS